LRNSRRNFSFRSGRRAPTVGFHVLYSSEPVCIVANSMLLNWDNAVNWWGLLLLVLPMLFMRDIMQVVELPRFILLAFFGVAFTAFLLWRGPKQFEIRQRLTRILGTLAVAFLGIMTIASCQAVNKQEALSFTLRYALMLLTAVLFALSVSRPNQHLAVVAKASVLAAIVQASVGILQFYDLSFTAIPPAGHSLPYGLQGNRNHYGSILALLFPFCGYAAYASKGPWKWLSVVSLWLCLYGLILSLTRSAWLATAAALLLSNSLVLLLRRKFGLFFVKGWFRAMAWILAGVVLGSFLALTIPGRGDIRKLSKKAASMLQFPTDNLDSTAAERLGFWKESLRMIREHPLLGVGPGNWRILAASYGYHQPGPIGQGVLLRSHAHNVYLQNGAETGFPGLALYVLMWMTAAVLSVKVILRSQDNNQRMLGMTAFAVICIFLIDSCFSSPNLRTSHSLLAALAIGLVVGLSQWPNLGSTPEAKWWHVSRSCFVLPALVAAFAVYFGCKKVSFEYHLVRARALMKLNQPEEVLKEVRAGLTRLVSVSPYDDTLELYAAYAYQKQGQNALALEAVRKANRLDPWSIFTLHFMGNIYASLDRPNEAIACYKKALTIAPEFQPALSGLARLFFKQGLFQECADTLQSFPYQNDPNLIYLAGFTYRRLKEPQKSVLILREGLLHFPQSADLVQLLAHIEYEDLKDFPGAMAHFQRVLELRPDHPNRSDYQQVIDYVAGRAEEKPKEPASVTPASRPQ
jgi:O-antigen ligase